MADRNENVLVVSFADGRDPQAALSALARLDSDQQLELVAACVVSRDAPGRVRVLSETRAFGVEGAVTAELLGVLVGILDGPLGALIGAAAGLFVGSLIDVYEDNRSESVLANIAETLQTDRPTLLAVVGEPQPRVVDDTLHCVGATVLRRPREDVEAEMAAVTEAQRDARRAARRSLHASRLRRDREQIHRELDRLRRALHARDANRPESGEESAGSHGR